MHIFSSFIIYVADILFPKTCSGCGRINTFLCEKCLFKIPRAEAPKNSFITALFDYRNPTIRNSIWRFKYRNAREISECFGKLMYEEIIGDIGESINAINNEIYLLVPIPLHTKRYRERGYNQSELLAREIIKSDKEKILVLKPDTLTRVRNTKAQVKKVKRQERFENLRDAFITSKETVKGKQVILIDDVTTTGATLSEARKTLLEAGALSVNAYTIAH